MAAFDADAYRQAREPFELTLGGRTYRARPVSAELVVRLNGELAADERRARKAIERLLRAAFPWRASYLWFGDPVRQFLALDVATRNAGLRDFFRFLGDVGTLPPPPATHGTP